MLKELKKGGIYKIPRTDPSKDAFHKAKSFYSKGYFESKDKKYSKAAVTVVCLHHPILPFKAIAHHPGIDFFSLINKKTSDKTDVNEIKRKGGMATAYVRTAMINKNRIHAEMRPLGQALIQDGALEMLLYIAAKGTVHIDELRDFPFIKLHVIELIDRLNQCGLLKILDNKISLTALSAKLIRKLQEDNQ